MSIKGDLVTYLRAFPGLTALVGTRVAFHHAAQSWRTSAGAVQASVVIQQIDGDHKHHTRGATGRVIGRFQLTCIDDDGVGGEAVAEQVRQALDGYRGAMGSTWISMCNLADQRSEHVPPSDGGGLGTYVESMDYMIGWTVTVPTPHFV